MDSFKMHYYLKSRVNEWNDVWLQVIFRAKVKLSIIPAGHSLVLNVLGAFSVNKLSLEMLHHTSTRLSMGRQISIADISFGFVNGKTVTQVCSYTSIFKTRRTASKPPYGGILQRTTHLYSKSYASFVAKMDSRWCH